MSVHEVCKDPYSIFWDCLQALILEEQMNYKYDVVSHICGAVCRANPSNGVVPLPRGDNHEVSYNMAQGQCTSDVLWTFYCVIESHTRAVYHT